MAVNNPAFSDKTGVLPITAGIKKTRPTWPPLQKNVDGKSLADYAAATPKAGIPPTPIQPPTPPTRLNPMGKASASSMSEPSSSSPLKSPAARLAPSTLPSYAEEMAKRASLGPAVRNQDNRKFTNGGLGREGEFSGFVRAADQFQSFDSQNRPFTPSTVETAFNPAFARSDRPTGIGPAGNEWKAPADGRQMKVDVAAYATRGGARINPLAQGVQGVAAAPVAQGTATVAPVAQTPAVAATPAPAAPVVAAAPVPAPTPTASPTPAPQYKNPIAMSEAQREMSKAGNAKLTGSWDKGSIQRKDERRQADNLALAAENTKAATDAGATAAGKTASGLVDSKAAEAKGVVEAAGKQAEIQQGAITERAASEQRAINERQAMEGGRRTDEAKYKAQEADAMAKGASTGMEAAASIRAQDNKDRVENKAFEVATQREAENRKAVGIASVPKHIQSLGMNVSQISEDNRKALKDIGASSTNPDAEIQSYLGTIKANNDQKLKEALLLIPEDGTGNENTRSQSWVNHYRWGDEKQVAIPRWTDGELSFTMMEEKAAKDAQIPYYKKGSLSPFVGESPAPATANGITATQSPASNPANGTPAPAAAAVPSAGNTKDGDTMTKDGVTYTRRGGKWYPVK